MNFKSFLLAAFLLNYVVLGQNTTTSTNTTTPASEPTPPPVAPLKLCDLPAGTARDMQVLMRDMHTGSFLHRMHARFTMQRAPKLSDFDLLMPLTKPSLQFVVDHLGASSVVIPTHFPVYQRVQIKAALQGTLHPNVRAVLSIESLDDVHAFLGLPNRGFAHFLAIARAQTDPDTALQLWLDQLKQTCTVAPPPPACPCPTATCTTCNVVAVAGCVVVPCQSTGIVATEGDDATKDAAAAPEPVVGETSASGTTPAEASSGTDAPAASTGSSAASASSNVSPGEPEVIQNAGSPAPGVVSPGEPEVILDNAGAAEDDAAEDDAAEDDAAEDDATEVDVSEDDVNNHRVISVHEIPSPVGAARQAAMA